MSPGITASPDQPTTFAATADPASSLRAAALLTLKSKRRRPTNDQSTAQVLPTRPPPLDIGFQLDYGQEDTTSSPHDGLTKTPTPGLAPAASISPVATPAEDVQMREEGEISDEENTLTPDERPSPDSTRSQSLPRPIGTAPHGRRSTPPKSTGPNLEVTQPRTKLSDRITESTFLAVSYGQDVASTSMAIDDIQEVSDSLLYSLDTDHVRPGLALTQAQYDTVKDIVLDLLGWGVAPEYLVDCGLTREIVYYVFNELDLRLPQNLDITGIVPYPPDIPILMERQPSVLMPPPATAVGGRSHLQANQLVLKPHGHAVQDTLAIPPTRTEPVPVETSPSPTTSSLHDMEQQRRQELLARKAAIASRKSKQLPATSDLAVSSFPASAPDPLITSTLNQDVEMTAPSETVDDFLKSIGPAAEENIAMDTEKPSQRRSVDMDLDEIPGLKGIPSNQPTPAQVADDAKVPHSVAPNAPESNDHPPSSSDSTNTAFTQSSNDTISLASDSQTLQRRGTRRPVAADFDQDLGPRVQNGSGYFNGVTYSGSFGKHRPSGFARVSGMRRCIIDLSDSEGEGDEEAGRDLPSYVKDRWGRRSGHSSPGPMVTFTGGWVTPPVSAITPGLAAASITAGASMSPAALAEKETQIRRMKEMIAQRERDRQKKLAASRSISNIDTNAPVVSITSVKQEELDTGVPLSTATQGNDPNGQASITLSKSAASDDHATTGLSLLADVVSAIPTSHGTAISSNGVVIDTNITQTSQSPVLTLEGHQEQAMNSSQMDVTDQQPRESVKHGIVDVDQVTSSSTQDTLPAHVNQDLSMAIPIASTRQHDENFTTYNSPFQLYPLLGSRSRSIQNSSSSSLHTCSTQGSLSSSNSPTSLRTCSTFSSFECPSSSLPASAYLTFSIPSLKPLKLAAVSHMLDPSKPVCQYEIPGGGICRDEGCEDIHLNSITGYGGSGGGVEPSDEDTAEYLGNTLPVDWLVEHAVSPSKILSTLQEIHEKNPQMDFEERVKEAVITLGAAPPPTPP